MPLEVVPVLEGALLPPDCVPVGAALPLPLEAAVEAPGGTAVVAGYAAPAALISKG